MFKGLPLAVQCAFLSCQSLNVMTLLIFECLFYGLPSELIAKYFEIQLQFVMNNIVFQVYDND